ncbi:MAG: 4Fe-4S single cluster domain-containing protein [Crocinitomicaceae bacterium]
MNISHIEEQSFIYGPGCRFVIWVQGCTIHCKGCWNKEMWSSKIKDDFTVADLLVKIKREEGFIEGITLLGGEPLDQIDEVVELLNECIANGLSTMVFTGYEMDEITNSGMNEILRLADILVTGRYVASKRTLNHQWIGSTNQEIHFLSDRYKEFIQSNLNYVEISIDESGRTTFLGFPDNKLMNDIMQIN